MMFFIKRTAVSVLTVALSAAAVHFLPEFSMTSYLNWAVYACVVGVIVLAITCIVNLIFSRKEFVGALAVAKNAFFSKVKK